MPPGTRQKKVVIKLGGGSVKSGFTGDTIPCSLCPTVIGTTSYTQYVGHDAHGLQYDPEAVFSYPIQHGLVTDFGELEKLINHVYKKELRVNSEDFPLCMTEVPQKPIIDKEKQAELVFERFNVPSYYVCSNAKAALCAAGRKTGLVLESGHDTTWVVPVYEGFPLPHAINKVELAGQDITNKLFKLLADRDVDLPGKSHRCDADIREELANNVICVGGSTTFPGFRERIQDELNCLLNPDGLPSYFATTKQGLNNGKEKRKQLVPSDEGCNVLCPDVEPRYLSWVGGTMLANKAEENEWVSRAWYDECGPNIVHKMCF